MFISVSFGLALLVTVWSFYRVTGGLFNPAVTLALWICGCVGAVRAMMLALAQILAGVTASALVSALTPGDVRMVQNALGLGVSVVQGLFTEALLTAVLVFTVLMLAAEKHRSTHLAPLGVGLSVFVCHLFGISQTGCGINPARSFGPSVVSGQFERYHWIYWIGPILGSLFAAVFYKILHAVDYQLIVAGQDADSVDPSTAPPKDLFSKVYKQALQWNGNLIFYLDTKAAAEACTKQQALREASSAGMQAPPSVQVYNPSDAAQTEAVQSGQAVVLNINDYPRSLLAGPNFSALSLGLPLAPMTNGTHRSAATQRSFFHRLTNQEEVRALMLQQQHQQQQEVAVAATVATSDGALGVQTGALGTMSACMQDVGAIAPPGSTNRS
ncbi:aquaporin-like protein [Ceraceosorus guamensis]|uniref:Aquaporin-like protein n=1 Tax=Ceraceosorus guamensis TaxID=1522189 RepID=A0A316VNY1_9BASI|nr:aquaporin-like protein [Ceraceosorus guamensis]PWN39286.1 aquaporin-like protein [Ceraceosorus guamensis]